jgi:hypothetical protein
MKRMLTFGLVLGFTLWFAAPVLAQDSVPGRSETPVLKWFFFWDQDEQEFLNNLNSPSITMTQPRFATLQREAISSQLWRSNKQRFSWFDEFLERAAILFNKQTK